MERSKRDTFGKGSRKKQDCLKAYQWARPETNLTQNLRIVLGSTIRPAPDPRPSLCYVQGRESRRSKELVSLRAIFKFIEVVKPAPKNDAVERKAAEVTNEVKNLFETRMAQYNRAIDLGRLFNYLPVSVTPHHVTKQLKRRCAYK
jgi:hypothetical protein